MKQHGLKTAGIVLSLLIIAVLIGFIFRGELFGNKESSGNLPHGESAQPETKDPADTQATGVRAALKTWDVYRLDDLDFDFVIAVLSVEVPADKAVALDHFRTDEGISLGSVSSYAKELEEHSYYLGRRNVMFSLVPGKEKYDAAVFIPLKDSSKENLILSCDLEGIEDMKIDLAKNVVTDGSSLYVSASQGEVISDEESYSLTVSRALDITDEMFYMVDSEGGRMQYRIPSANRVYAFEITAHALGSDSVVITDAEFIPDGFEEGYYAMDGSIRSMKETNIIGRSILTEDSGFLFFEVYGPEYSPVTYHGVLFLYLEGQDGPISIPVDLN